MRVPILLLLTVLVSTMALKNVTHIPSVHLTSIYHTNTTFIFEAIDVGTGEVIDTSSRVASWIFTYREPIPCDSFVLVQWQQVKSRDTVTRGTHYKDCFVLH
jgi:hypothetical protein